MKSNLKKKIGIMIIIVIIICCICAGALYILNRNNLDVNVEEDIVDGEGDEEVEYTTEKLRDPTKFFSVESCIQNNIDENFVAKDMDILEGENIFNYSVYGTIGTDEVYFIVRVDMENMTFLLEKLDTSNYNSVDEINLTTNIEQIENDGKNTFEYTTVSDEDMCRIYLEQFSKLELEDVETAYSLLDEKYKEERFQTFDNYKEYVEGYKEIIEDSALAKYSVNHYDNYTEYVLVDTHNNSYILEAIGVMKYTIKLDNYTIKVDSYKDEYAKLNDQNKVQSNVYIFLQMINTKDYKHAYDLLDDTFKNNNFATLEEFKVYVQNNFFSYNLNAIDISIKKEGNYYIYETSLKNNSSSAAETKKLTVIMELKEGTDFVMSFSIE